jgi:hypothetical protein
MLCDLAEAVRVEISEPLGNYLHEIFDKFAELELALSRSKRSSPRSPAKTRPSNSSSNMRGPLSAARPAPKGLRGVPGRDGRPGLRGD